MSPKARRRIASALSIAAMSTLALGLWLRPEPAADPPPAVPPSPAQNAAAALALARVALPPPPPPEAPIEAVTEAPAPPPPEPEPKPESPAPNAESPAPPPVERTVVATPQDIRDGRVLLRRLEAGDGPAIEIAWPETAADRDGLYHTFVRCYGMVTALLSDAGHLYRDGGAAGVNWRPDTDTFSQYARQAAGRMPPEEERLVARIRARHRLAGGTPVRLFPRRIDAVLLSGLSRLAGDGYEAGRAIRARYRVSGSRVDVLAITVGAQPVAGTVTIGTGCP